MHYINIKSSYGIETIDEFETRKEAREMLIEYRMIYAIVYISQRCTRDWSER